ncbi:NAD kinase [Floricoccus tropicus]|uniref:NAD kinase n=2 Tax=Floricoccus tropicus TaxID=1859473 RepID=A0A1E8GJ30_9LACT|nr:NAD kinase [Floricoccus tropicus]
MTMMNITDGKRVAFVSSGSAESVDVEKKIRKKLKVKRIEVDPKTPDIVISIGGDGTLLEAVHTYGRRLDTIRFVGVHTGHLGFYTDYLCSEVEELVEAIVNEDPKNSVAYPVLKMKAVMADGQIFEKYALNESTVRRLSRTLVADVFISNFLFERFRGDGLSISTPTGSTAYNKSIGGAVLHPGLKVMQMAEIASLNNRVYRTLGAPVVVTEDENIILNLDKALDYSLTIDRLEYKFTNLAGLEYSLDGTVVRFLGGRHSSFWKRVQESFIGDVN